MLFRSVLLSSFVLSAFAEKKYDSGASDTEIRIGQTKPYSGPASAYSAGGHVQAGYFEKINAEGGINGRKIKLISLDDAFTPPKTVEQTRKLIEQDQVLLVFNSNGTAATFDTRSDNKGPEPEGVVLGKAFGRTYAFIGLERTAGVMVYDVSDPFHPSFVQYVNTSPDDISPEGLLFIKEDESPNGKPLLVLSHEISSTTTIFEINKGSASFFVAVGGGR